MSLAQKSIQIKSVDTRDALLPSPEMPPASSSDLGSVKRRGLASVHGATGERATALRTDVATARSGDEMQ